MLSPVAIFTYKRSNTLKRMLDALVHNELSNRTELYIFSDGPRDASDVEAVTAVRRFIECIEEFCAVHVIRRDRNYGLVSNITDGVTFLLEKYPYVIVLEDDLVTGPFFLKFMNDALEMYLHDDAVCQVSGYSYLECLGPKYQLDDQYFIKGADCLAWGTWRRAWSDYREDSAVMANEIRRRGVISEFNRDTNYNYYKMLKRMASGQINSWAINWYAANFLKDHYTLYPLKSLALHIGNDNATNYCHNTRKDPLDVPLYRSEIPISRMPIVEKEQTRQAYNLFLKRSRGNLLQQIKAWGRNRIRRFRRTAYRRGKHA